MYDKFTVESVTCFIQFNALRSGKMHGNLNSWQ